MADFRNIDWAQERPDSQQLESDWLGSHIHSVSEIDPRLGAVVANLQRTHNNGGALAAQFLLEVKPAVSWYLTRNRLAEAGFFEKFFSHEVVSQRLIRPSSAKTDDDLGFSLESPFVAMGRLAHIISNGGAYSHFEGADTEILKLVDDFSQAAFENRYSEARAYLSWKPWSRWFKDIAWDASFFWLDLRKGVATVLVITDTD